ncbi:MAG: hypothetical protein H0T46_30465 [Deltaproteobacteria bacterium]|nr:hypothetical protein [Deltaproteobacteria bacterium]
MATARARALDAHGDVATSRPLHTDRPTLSARVSTINPSAHELYADSGLQWVYSAKPEDGFDPTWLHERFRDPKGRRVFALRSTPSRRSRAA